MSTIVVMPGGFHPFHAGHASLYQSALKAFPDADVYVAATDSQKERPFPFAIKEKLAKLAGVAPGHFIQVKSPFKAEEITRNYDPNSDVLIFVRSEKDKTEQPIPGGTKKDGSPSYFQPYTGKDLQPFSKHAYIAYLPTIEFGPGITSASEIILSSIIYRVLSAHASEQSIKSRTSRGKRRRRNKICINLST